MKAAMKATMIISSVPGSMSSLKAKSIWSSILASINNLGPLKSKFANLATVRESPSRRPFNKLGRMGAVREKHNVVRDIRGHRFVQKKFFNVMKCAFCSEFLVKTGYQCEGNKAIIDNKVDYCLFLRCFWVDCIFTCHEKCVAKVFTKCITNVDSGPASISHSWL